MFTQEEMNEVKLLSYVTHELGNQLTLINSTAQLMESKNPEIHNIPYWNQLRNDIETMKELFVSFSQYRHYSQPECMETDLIDLADETVESFQAMAAEKNITVTLEESEELDVSVLAYVCDPVKIRQVMINLIKNALEAVIGGEKIWVRVLGTKQTASDCIRIEIGNNGQLIKKEDLNTIFDFGISSKGENRGIGLALAHKIVKAHNGELQVSSEEVNGERQTVFSICLPA